MPLLDSCPVESIAANLASYYECIYDVFEAAGPCDDDYVE